MKRSWFRLAAWQGIVSAASFATAFVGEHLLVLCVINGLTALALSLWALWQARRSSAA